MRAGKIRLSLLLFVLCMPAWALGLEVQDQCNPDLVEKKTEVSMLHPSVFYEAQKPLIEENRWLEIVRTIRESFENAPVPHDANYALYLAEVRKLEDELENLRKSANSDELMRAAKGVTLVRFQPRNDTEEDRVFLFGPDTGRLTIDKSMGPAVIKEYCWRTIGINKILTRYGEPGRDAAALALRNYISQWDAYNENGYLQYPWELYLNSKWTFDVNQLAPPRHQLVIAHPGIAVEQAGESFEKSRRDDVVTFEPLGYLWYAESRKTYYGVSSLLTLSSKQDTGRGVLLHFGKFAKLGYVWRDEDAEGRSRNGVVFSMDLYQMLADPPQLQVELRKRVKRLYDSRVNAGASGRD